MLFGAISNCIFFSVKSPQREYISLPTYLPLSKDNKMHAWQSLLSVLNKYAIISGYCFKEKLFPQKRLSSFLNISGVGLLPPDVFNPWGLQRNICFNTCRLLSCSSASSGAFLWIASEGHRVISLTALENLSFHDIPWGCWAISDGKV
jgi:hypothetical protein